MLRHGQIKQEAEFWVVLLLEHDSLLKGATVLHDVHCHSVNDVKDAVISGKTDFYVWNCSKICKYSLIAANQLRADNQN